MNERKENNPLPTGGGGSKRPSFNIYWVYGLLIIAFIALQYVDFNKGERQVSWTEFKQLLIKDSVERMVMVNKDFVEIYVKKPKTAEPTPKDQFFSKSETPSLTYKLGSEESFDGLMRELQKKHPKSDIEKVYPPKYETRADFWGSAMAWLFPIFLLIILWVFIFRRMGGGAGGPGAHIFNIGKSKAKIFNQHESKVKTNFKDVAGLEEAKVEIQEIVDFLKNPTKYTELGGKIPKGALLVGPPGTGKTLLAKAVAGEAGVPFFSMSGSDFVEMFVGVGASRVRDLFKQAKEKAPCIVFIDEIDAIGRARGKNPNFGSNDERENTLNQLLTEMDGFETNAGVIVLAATNRADILDKALMRAGRFDRQIHVELPDVIGREEIFKVHLTPIKVSAEVIPEFLAKQTPGFSGADIANVCNEAALIAARRNKTEVEKQDFLDAVDRIIGGLEKRNKIITPEEKKTIAYHEAGHATLSWLLDYAHPLIKVTIIPRGKALGAAWYLPEERQITTKEQILDEMVATMGGRAAEELTFGKISTGALNDLERITKQAYALVSYFGMSDKIGHLSFYNSSGESEYGFTKPYSEKTSELIDSEAKVIISACYERACKVLSENSQGLGQLAALLLEREVIFAEDLERIFGKRRAIDRLTSASNPTEPSFTKLD